jgi:serine/threonine protein kinase/WD40 repeat protein
LPPDQREAFLRNVCGDDEALLGEVRALLASADELDSADEARPTLPVDRSEQPTAPPAEERIGTKVGQYTIRKIIGEGGMGVVYEAMQQSPRRLVAVKMLKRGIESKATRRRFEYEGEVLGRLRHENIAQIYEAGTIADDYGLRPWFAMEYVVGGKPITQYANDEQLGTRERLRLFMKVCDAVQHGHGRGVIHRDVKPANILVTPAGTPKVIDFGVARSTDLERSITTLQTDVGMLVGTLQYMSPEQCVADPGEIDSRTDVYALGMVLYELLCQRLPYDLRRAALHEAARVIVEDPPSKPSTHDRRLRGDVETIALKALEKDRKNRYQSASAMGEDIGRYLSGDPITARRLSGWETLVRFSRRHVAMATSIVSIFLTLIVATALVTTFWSKSIQSEAMAHQGAYHANVALAERAVAQGEVESARKMLEDAKGHWPAGQPLPFEWRYLTAQTDDAAASIDLPPPTKCTAVLGTADGGAIMGIQGGGLVHWDGAGDSLLTLDASADGVLSMALSPDGDWIACGGADGLITLRERVTGNAIVDAGGAPIILDPAETPGRSRAEDLNVLSLAWSADGLELLSGHKSGAVHLWRISKEVAGIVVSGERIYTHQQRDEGGGRTVNVVAFGPDRSVLVGCKDHRIMRVLGDRSVVQVWQGSAPSASQGHQRQRGVIDLVIGGGSKLIFASQDGVKRLDLSGTRPQQSAESILSTTQSGGDVSAVDCADGLLCAAGDDGRLRVWSASAPSFDADPDGRELHGHTAAVLELTFTSRGEEVISVSVDGTARVWDLHGGMRGARVGDRLVLPGVPPGQVCFMHGDRWLVSAGLSKRAVGSVQVWDLDIGTMVGEHLLDWVPVSLAIRESGDVLAVSGGTDPGAGQVLFCATDLLDPITNWVGDWFAHAVAWSPNGQAAVMADENGMAHRFHAVRARRGHSPIGFEYSTRWRLHDEPVFSPQLAIGDGGIVAQSVNGGFGCWPDIENDRPNQRWHRPGLNGEGGAIAIAPGGERVAVAHGDGSVAIVSIHTGDELVRWANAHVGAVFAVCWSPSGDRLFTGGKDGVLAVWDPESATRVATMGGSRGGSRSPPIRHLAIDSNGTRLVAVRDDGTLRVWDAQSAGHVTRARRRALAAQAQCQPSVDAIVAKSGGDVGVLRALGREEMARQPDEMTALATQAALLTAATSVR